MVAHISTKWMENRKRIREKITGTSAKLNVLKL